MSTFEILLLLFIAIYIGFDFYFGYTNRKLGLKNQDKYDKYEDSIQSLSTQCINLNNELINYKHQNENLYIQLVSVTKERDEFKNKLKKKEKKVKNEIVEAEEKIEKD